MTEQNAKKIDITCPICGAKHNLEVSQYKFEEYSDLLNTVLKTPRLIKTKIPPGTVCEHTFEIILDKNFNLKAYSHTPQENNLEPESLDFDDDLLNGEKYSDDTIADYLQNLMVDDFEVVKENFKVLVDDCLNVDKGFYDEDLRSAMEYLWQAFEYYLKKENKEFMEMFVNFLWDVNFFRPDPAPFGFDNPFGFNLKEYKRRYTDRTDKLESIIYREPSYDYPPLRYTLIDDQGTKLLLKALDIKDVKNKNRIIQILRFMEQSAEEILTKFRKIIYILDDPLILSNILLSMGLLAVKINDTGDISLFKSFMHQDYPNMVRMHALFALFVDTGGALEEVYAKIIVQFLESNDYNVFPQKTEQFPLIEVSRTQLQKEQLEKLNQNSLLKEKSKKDQHYGYLKEFEASKYLYCIKKGANEIFAPLILDLLENSELEWDVGQVSIEEALLNVLEYLIPIMFPSGFTKWASSNKKPNKGQNRLLKILLDVIQTYISTYNMDQVKILIEKEGFNIDLKKFILT